MENPKVLETNSIEAWIKFLDVHLNEPAVNKNVRQIRYLASTLSGDNKLAWLLKAISFIDLTTLSGDDTSAHVENLCQKAVRPFTVLPLEWKKPLHTAAVCVYPSRVKDVITAFKKLKTDTVKIASVAGGFPSGQYPLESRLQEVHCAIEYGAQEIDVVIDRSLVLNHEWLKLYHELAEIRAVCNKKKAVCLKVILSTGELFSLKNVYKASMVAMFAGANFIKTSTGKEAVNATLPVGVVMCRAIKEYERLTSTKVGFKPAGGIKTAQEALEWMVLIKEELGKAWLTNTHFRIGASSLLDDITKEIINMCTLDDKPLTPFYESEVLEVFQSSEYEEKIKPKSEEKKTKPESEEKTKPKSEEKNKSKSEEKTKSKKEERQSKSDEKSKTKNEETKKSKSEEKTELKNEEKTDSKREERQTKSEEKTDPKREERQTKSEEKTDPKREERQSKIEEKTDPKSEEEQSQNEEETDPKSKKLEIKTY